MWWRVLPSLAEKGRQLVTHFSLGLKYLIGSLAGGCHHLLLNSQLDLIHPRLTTG